VDPWHRGRAKGRFLIDLKKKENLLDQRGLSWRYLYDQTNNLDQAIDEVIQWAVDYHIFLLLAYLNHQQR
jgi:hypothetical protein